MRSTICCAIAVPPAANRRCIIDRLHDYSVILSYFLENVHSFAESSSFVIIFICFFVSYNHIPKKAGKRLSSLPGFRLCIPAAVFSPCIAVTPHCRRHGAAAVCPLFPSGRYGAKNRGGYTAPVFPVSIGPRRPGFEFRPYHLRRPAETPYNWCFPAHPDTGSKSYTAGAPCR